MSDVSCRNVSRGTLQFIACPEPSVTSGPYRLDDLLLLSLQIVDGRLKLFNPSIFFGLISSNQSMIRLMAMEDTP